MAYDLRISYCSSDVCSPYLGRGEGGGAGDRGVDGDPARRGRTRALLRAARRTGRAPRPAAALDGNECRLRDGGDARRNPCPHRHRAVRRARSEEHTSELQSLMRTSYAVFCLKKQQNQAKPPYSQTPLTHNTQTNMTATTTL